MSLAAVKSVGVGVRVSAGTAVAVGTAVLVGGDDGAGVTIGLRRVPPVATLVEGPDVGVCE